MIMPLKELSLSLSGKIEVFIVMLELHTELGQWETEGDDQRKTLN